MNRKIEHKSTGEITKSEYYYFVSDISVDEFMRVRRHHWSLMKLISCV